MDNRNSNCNYIVAIDFGTSRTGFSWSIYGSVADSKDVHVRTEWPNMPHSYVKTYSELSYDKENNKWYYGGDARYLRLYGETPDDYKQIDYSQIESSPREFKMDLYDSEKKQSGETMKWIIETLKWMKEEAWMSMSANLGNTFTRSVFEKEILWVLTVPEGATDDAKASMRQAAEEAGLIRKDNDDFTRLMFAFEPEAAIVACIKDDITTKLINQEQIIVVFDAGGGTIDVSVRKYCPKNHGASKKLVSIKGILGECEAAGSQYTKQQFFDYVKNLFGEDIFNHLIDDYRTEFYRLEEGWEKTKESTVAYSEGRNFKFAIDIGVLWELYEEYSKHDCELLQTEIKEKNQSIVKNEFEYRFSGPKNKYLNINYAIFNKICMPIFERAYIPLKKVFQRLEDHGMSCDSLFFIGGFSCNPCLREFIKKQILMDFNEKKKISYIEMEGVKICSAVLVGATLYGEDPGIIASRVSKLTYGTDLVGDGFATLVSKGDIVNFNELSKHVFNPVHPNQTQVSFRFYSANESGDTIKKCTDPCLKELKKVMLKSPNTDKGTDRNFIVTLEFGSTETTVTMFDEASGNKEITTLAIPFEWQS